MRLLRAGLVSLGLLLAACATGAKDADRFVVLESAKFT